MRAPDSFSTSFSTEELLGSLESPGEECFGLSDSLYHMTSSLAGDCDLKVPLQSTPVLTMILSHARHVHCPISSPKEYWLPSVLCYKKLGLHSQPCLVTDLQTIASFLLGKNPKWKLTILKLLGTWRSILAKSQFIGWMPSRKRLIFLPGLKLPT